MRQGSDWSSDDPMLVSREEDNNGVASFIEVCISSYSQTKVSS